MITTEEKLALISGELEKAIAGNIIAADNSMKTLELMNPTQEQYRKASTDLMCATFKGTYLARIINVANAGDVKNLENAMRFNAYQLRTKGDAETVNASEVNDNFLAIAQGEIADFLSSIVERYFED